MTGVILALALIVVAVGAVIIRVLPPAPAVPTEVRITGESGLVLDFCAGCGHTHRAGAMAFTTSGAYRCRVCCYGKEL